MIKYIFITNDPALAQFAQSAGVQRIMIDLEVDGKQARQGHLDTLISQHSFADIAPVKAVLSEAELIVRLNPLGPTSQAEIDMAVADGADILMLPMFHSAQQVAEFSDMVGGRAGIMPLVETFSAAQDIASVAAVPGVTEVFIGLNDLHLDMQLKFMFETVASGLVEELVSQVQAVGKSCGFGGIARVGEGLIPGEMVLAEHVRLGSAGVILSRTFHGKSGDLADLQNNIDLAGELSKLRAEEAQLRQEDAQKLDHIHRQLQQGVTKIVTLKSTSENV